MVKRKIDKKELIIMVVSAIIILGIIIFGVITDPGRNINDTNLEDYNATENNLVVEMGDSLIVDYELFVDNNLRDSSIDRNTPFEFTVGQGVVEGFSKGVLGMSVGDTKTFIVSPEEGYGPLYTDYNYSMSSLMQMAYEQTGEQYDANTLVEGKAKFNTAIGECFVNDYIKETDTAIFRCKSSHPLAGKELTFRVTILDINKADT